MTNRATQWLDYEGGLRINQDVAEFGESLDTAAVWRDSAACYTRVGSWD